MDCQKLVDGLAFLNINRWEIKKRINQLEDPSKRIIQYADVKNIRRMINRWEESTNRTVNIRLEELYGALDL